MPPGATASQPANGGRVRLIDGGTGTELRRRGVMPDPAAWSAPAALTHPQVLAAVHADYIDAGADIITANTFASTRFVLDSAGLGAHFDAINNASLDAAFRARDAARREVAVAASLSCLPPRFDPQRYPAPEEEYAAYAELLSLFAARGVDLIVLEMMQDTAHGARACRAARASGLPWWLGISCRMLDDRCVAFDAPDVDVGPVISALVAHAPDAVTIMHSPLEASGPGLALARQFWDGPVGCYPECSADVTPAALAAHAGDWISSGIGIVGGCCGTTPAHTRALRRMLDA